jgi:hypothetical protein
MKKQYGGLNYTPAQQLVRNIIDYLLNKDMSSFLITSSFLNSKQIMQLDKIKRDPNIMGILRRLNQPEIAEKSIDRINILKHITDVIDESDLPYTEIRKIFSQSDKLTDIIIQIVSATKYKETNTKTKKVKNEDIVLEAEIIDNSQRKAETKEENYLQLIQQAKMMRNIEQARIERVEHVDEEDIDMHEGSDDESGDENGLFGGLFGGLFADVWPPAGAAAGIPAAGVPAAGVPAAGVPYADAAQRVRIRADHPDSDEELNFSDDDDLGLPRGNHPDVAPAVDSDVELDFGDDRNLPRRNPPAPPPEHPP